MAYWRKLFLVVLLALSLPVQSFAAISLKCGLSHFGDMAFAQHIDVEESTHHHHMHDVMMTVDHHSHHSGDAQHAHSCSTCASCCFGAGLPVATTVATAAEAVGFAAPLPPSVRVPSFLTDGVERPPRISLV